MVEELPPRPKTAIHQRPEPVPEPPAPSPVPAPPPMRAEKPERSEKEEVLREAAKLVAMALSVRALMGVSLFGAIVLGLIAAVTGHIMAVVALGVYAALTMIPLVVLETRKR